MKGLRCEECQGTKVSCFFSWYIYGDKNKISTNGYLCPKCDKDEIARRKKLHEKIKEELEKEQ